MSPTDWERSACTRDGVPYRIRPIRADDMERERAFLMGLSPESRYARMMCAIREPSPELLEHFVHVDYRRDMAFVAVIEQGGEERFIGVARYAAPPSGTDCEFAVAVADAWQCRGIGTTLTRLLFQYAAAMGFRRVRGLVLAQNDRMRQLAGYLGMSLQHSPDSASVVEAWLDLTPPAYAPQPPC